MIPPADQLIEMLDIFADSQELAGALRDMAGDADLGLLPTQVYYLKECAMHIEGLHKHAHELARALQVARRLAATPGQPSPTGTSHAP